MRVLMSAYACEPERGSEPGVGWSWALALSQFTDVWVVTRSNNRPQIDKALGSEGIPNLRFVFCDLPPWLRFWKKAPGGLELYYYLWQLVAYLRVRRLHQESPFDVVHHLTFVRYWSPSFLSLLPVPFLWGPVGGGESAPRAFLSALGFRGVVSELVRDATRRLCELDPFVRRTARRAAVGLATTEETRIRMKRVGCQDVRICSQLALARKEYEKLSQIPRRTGQPFRLISLGRMLHWKGFAFGLRAFAAFSRSCPEAVYWFVGDGPERRKLEALARTLGVIDRVVFWGELTRGETLEKLAECDVLVHPSLHDSGGWVCLEAMAVGRPVVCLDLGGPGVQINEETGIKVQAVDPGQVVADLTEAFRELARNPRSREQMGSAGRERALRSFTWEEKAPHLLELYRSCVSQGERSP